MSSNKKINQVRTGAVLSYINMAIGSLIPMFYTPIMLQLLGQSEYGLYKLSSSVTSYLSLISFGVGSAVVRYFTKYRAEGDKEGEENIFGLFNIVFMVISAVTLIAGLIIVFFIEPIYGNALTEKGQIDELRILVAILSASAALNFLCTPYNSVVTSHERFLFLQLINILTTVVTPIFNLAVLFLGFKSIGMVSSTFLLTIIIRLVYIIYVRKTIGMKPRYNNMPKYLLKEILQFSFWVFVANVVNQLYNSTDTIIIGAIPALATVGVAIYNVGFTFNSMVFNFSTGLLSVLTPKINMMVFSNSSNKEFTDIMIRVGRLQCYIVSIMTFGFIAFGRQFVYLWAGDGYQEAYWVAIATMIPSCIPLIQNVALNVIVAQNKHRFRSIVFFVIAVINVLGTLICVNYFGIIGAAVVSGVAFILGQGLVMNWYYWKKIKLEIPRFWKNVSKIFLMPIIMTSVVLILSTYIDFYSWSSFFVGVIIYSLIYIVINWCFIMNDYEKDIFRAPIKKLANKLRKKNITQ